MHSIPWIRLYVSFFTHRKTMRLRRELGTIEPVLRLWVWAAENAPDGDLSGISDEDLEDAMGWRGEPGKAIGCIRGCGFLDGSLLHGWEERTGAGIESLTRARKLSADRQQRYRERHGNALPNEVETRLSRALHDDRRGEERRVEERKEEDQEKDGGQVDNPLPPQPGNALPNEVETRLSRALHDDRRGEERRVEERKEEDQEKDGGQEQLALTEAPTALSPSLFEPIRSVFAHYRTYHPRACPNPKSTSTEWRKIRARMEGGYSASDLCEAIDGYHKDQWHIENGQLSLELMMRDDSHVTAGLGFNGSRPTSKLTHPPNVGGYPAPTQEPIVTGRMRMP
jgi:hypothetical protein